MFMHALKLRDEGSERAAIEAESLWQIADQFRIWVVRDLESLPQEERAGFRGDYLFIIDQKPSFLVLVSPDSVSCGRIFGGGEQPRVEFDMGSKFDLTPDVLSAILNDGAVRVRVTTDSNTLRRLLGGTMKAKIAYLNGLVKISGDLPCFMRLVAVLKGRGVGPLKATAHDASGSPAPRLSR